MKIRPIALCLITHKGRLLVFEGSSPEQGSFFRPLGGGIEFGERAAEAAVREMQEDQLDWLKSVM